jgi:DNA-binding CsgD family transcriptional regulator
MAFNELNNDLDEAARGTHRSTELPRRGLHKTHAPAFGEFGTSIAFKLNETVTTLLLHLQILERASELQEAGAISRRNRDLLERAIREADRVRDIIQQIPQIQLSDSLSCCFDSNFVPTTRSFPGHDRLTPREREVLAQIAAAASSKETARLLGISPRTVGAHRARIMAKLRAKNAADLVRIVLNK